MSIMLSIDVPYVNSPFDVGAMIGFGVLGYLMQKLGFPAVPLVFGLILGPMLEENVRRTLVVSDGSWLIYVQRPISVTLLGLSVLTAAYPAFLEYRARRRGRGHVPPLPPPG
jgi:putative tricarboxylic transport membrane protein